MFGAEGNMCLACSELQFTRSFKIRLCLRSLKSNAALSHPSLSHYIVLFLLNATLGLTWWKVLLIPLYDCNVLRCSFVCVCGQSLRQFIVPCAYKEGRNARVCVNEGRKIRVLVSKAQRIFLAFTGYEGRRRKVPSRSF